MDIKEDPDIAAQLALTLAAGGSNMSMSWPQSNPMPAPQAHTSMLSVSSESHGQHLTEPPPAHAHGVHKPPEPFVDKCKFYHRTGHYMLCYFYQIVIDWCYLCYHVNKILRSLSILIFMKQVVRNGIPQLYGVSRASVLVYSNNNQRKTFSSNDFLALKNLLFMHGARGMFIMCTNIKGRLLL